METWEPILVAQLWQACGGEVNAGPPGRSPANSSNNSQFSLYCLEKCKVANFWTHKKKAYFNFFARRILIEASLWGQPYGLLASYLLRLVTLALTKSFLLSFSSRYVGRVTCDMEHSGWLKPRTSVMLSSSPPSFTTWYTISVVRIKACGIWGLHLVSIEVRPLGWCPPLLQRLACRCSCNLPTSEAPDKNQQFINGFIFLFWFIAGRGFRNPPTSQTPFCHNFSMKLKAAHTIHAANKQMQQLSYDGAHPCHPRAFQSTHCNCYIRSPAECFLLCKLTVSTCITRFLYSKNHRKQQKDW